MLTIRLFSLFALSICACVARPEYEHNAKPFANALQARQEGGGNSSSSLQVDLGYGMYEGVQNSTSGLNIWKG